MPRRSAPSASSNASPQRPARERPGERVVSVHGRAKQRGLPGQRDGASWLNPVVGSVNGGLEIDLYTVRVEQSIDHGDRPSLSPRFVAPSCTVEQLGVQRTAA